VLSVCHVYEILLEFAVGGDWKEAFLRIIPQRTGIEPVPRTSAPSRDDSSAEEDSGDHADAHVSETSGAAPASETACNGEP
jgi:hypothetical protein